MKSTRMVMVIWRRAACARIALICVLVPVGQGEPGPLVAGVTPVGFVEDRR